MSIKKALRALAGNVQGTEQEKKVRTVQAIISDEHFPIIQPSQLDIAQYKKIPLMGVAALGASFSQLPAAARTIVQSVTTHSDIGGPLFVGFNPKGVIGLPQTNSFGINGNIMQLNPQGKNVIAGRMRFKELTNGLPVTSTISSTIPFDPTSLVIAAALANIEQRLASIQKIAEEILQFLKLKEQTKQRGNLNMLAEFLDEYKQNHENEKLCNLRNIEVQTIKREASQSILFHQEQIAQKLKNQQSIHGAQMAQEMLGSVMSEFYEYQLACYLYSFASFLDIMLQKNFEKISLDAAAMKIDEHTKRYTELFMACRSQITNYQRTTIEAQVMGGIGGIAAFLGRAIASVPVLRDGPVDEALLGAGQSIGKQNDETLRKSMEKFEQIEDSRTGPFIESIRTVNTLYNTPGGLLMDSENLYILQTAQ